MLTNKSRFGFILCGYIGARLQSYSAALFRQTRRTWFDVLTVLSSFCARVTSEIHIASVWQVFRFFARRDRLQNNSFDKLHVLNRYRVSCTEHITNPWRLCKRIRYFNSDDIFCNRSAATDWAIVLHAIHQSLWLQNLFGDRDLPYRWWPNWVHAVVGFPLDELTKKVQRAFPRSGCLKDTDSSLYSSYAQYLLILPCC